MVERVGYRLYKLCGVVDSVERFFRIELFLFLGGGAGRGCARMRVKARGWGGGSVDE